MAVMRQKVVGLFTDHFTDIDFRFHRFIGGISILPIFFKKKSLK
jgi:hypothetical protein